jgi:cytochrome o ubiquinol oxidase subunit 3
LAVTFALGASFVAMEVHEFNDLASHGHSWHQSGFLSAYFTLVGTHGLHISIGLLWAAVLMFTIYKKGLGRNTLRKLTLFSLFWHFLDLIWIFIFTIVYLYGVIPL